MHRNMRYLKLNVLLLTALLALCVRMNDGATKNFTITSGVYEDWIVSEQTLTVQGDCFPEKCTYNDSSTSYKVQTTFKFYDNTEEVGTVRVSLQL